jgi:hypothetical protein
MARKRSAFVGTLLSKILVYTYGECVAKCLTVATLYSEELKVTVLQGYSPCLQRWIPNMGFVVVIVYNQNDCSLTERRRSFSSKLREKCYITQKLSCT